MTNQRGCRLAHSTLGLDYLPKENSLFGVAKSPDRLFLAPTARRIEYSSSAHARSDQLFLIAPFRQLSRSTSFQNGLNSSRSCGIGATKDVKWTEGSAPRSQKVRGSARDSSKYFGSFFVLPWKGQQPKSVSQGLVIRALLRNTLVSPPRRW